MIIAPIAAEATDKIVELDQGEQSSRLEAELDDLSGKISDVIEGAEKTRRTDEFTVPNSVQDIELRNKILIVEVNGSNTRNLSRFFAQNLTGTIPSDQGLHNLRIENIGEEVNITEVEE